MIKAILSDFSYVLLFPKDKNFQGSINGFYREHFQEPNFNAFDYFYLNTDLLDFYKSLKDRTPIYIFTTDIVQDAPEFKPFLEPVFSNIFSARKMETNKKVPEAYTLVAATLNLKPDEILFLDDTSANIEAASTAGLQTILYTDYESLHNQITEALNS